jgi:hypothetical protein
MFQYDCLMTSLNSKSFEYKKQQIGSEIGEVLFEMLSENLQTQ